MDGGGPNAGVVSVAIAATAAALFYLYRQIPSKAEETSTPSSARNPSSWAAKNSTPFSTSHHSSQDIGNDDNWDDVAIPAGPLKRSIRNLHEEADDENWDATLTASEPLKQDAVRSLRQSNQPTTGDEEDWNDIEIPANLSFARKPVSRQLFPTRPIRFSMSSSTNSSTTTSETEDEGYDDLIFPQSGSLRLRTADDEWSGIVIPEDAVLDHNRLMDARNGTVRSSSPAKLEKTPSKGSSDFLVQPPPFASVYGTGNELDNIADLPISQSTPAPQNMRSKIPQPTNRQNLPLKTRSVRRPVLIKNLNSTHQARQLGNMTYNPVQQRWEGNWDALREFEHSTPQNRPALIANLSGRHTPQVIGGMIFDPVKMCWTGNEEDGEIFSGLEFDVGASPSVGNAKNAFDLSPAMIESFKQNEAQHNRMVASWLQLPSTRTRDHLHMIRDIATKLSN